jgi:hypothetical protein
MPCFLSRLVDFCVDAAAQGRTRKPCAIESSSAGLMPCSKRAYGPPVPGEDRDITEIRKILELTRESSGEPTVAEVKAILERARIEAKAPTGTAVSERYSC